MKSTLLLSLVAAASLLVGCAPKQVKISAPECPTATFQEWGKVFEKPVKFVEAYGAVYETYIDLEAKTTQPHNTLYKSCKMERIYCPAPNAEKGCQKFNCSYDEVAGAVMRSTDHQGKRYFKVTAPSTVHWDGTTFRCAPK